MNPTTVNPQHLDHAVRTGLISAGFIGISIGILYGLTHSAQIGTVLTDAIDIYGDSSGVSFDTASPSSPDSARNMMSRSSATS